MKKILLINNILTPYRIDMFNEISKLQDTDFQVLFMRENEPNRQWKIKYNEIRFNYEVLKGIMISIKKPIETFFHFNPGLLIKLIKKNPDVVVIAGYHQLHYYVAKLYTFMFHKKLVLWNESHALSSTKNDGLIKLIKGFAVPLADRYLTPSSCSDNYLINYGAIKKNIYRFYNTVNLEVFSRKQLDKAEVKDKQGAFKLVYTGVLEDRKGVGYAIEALMRIKENWTLKIIGDGSKSEELNKLVCKYSLQNKVQFLGFLDRTEIARVFSQSDYFIFPTLNDPCPLVINEALASGLFCITSKYAGNAEEFIENYKNGIIINPFDIDDFEKNIRKAFKLRGEINKEYIATSIIKASPYNVARQFKQCIEGL